MRFNRFHHLRGLAPIRASVIVGVAIALMSGVAPALPTYPIGAPTSATGPARAEAAPPPGGGVSKAALPGSAPLTGDVGQHGDSSTCLLNQPAFCDPLNAAFPVDTRSGQLDGVLWGTSRTNLLSPGQGQVDAWAPTNLHCDGTTQQGVAPPNDVQICGGQMAEAMTDVGNVATFAFYPRQPFDFAGRVGKATFDVSDDSEGGHMAWPVWQITDQPVPAPHANVNQARDALPRNGFGFALDNACGTGCPGSGVPPAGTYRQCVTVGEMWRVTNYVLTQVPYTVDGCVIQPAGPGSNNHFEVDISASGVTILGTDAGQTTGLRQIAHASAAMPLTRGLVWLEDVHYNGSKEPGTQGTHTFTWANIGFDGPVLPRDLGIDCPDASVAWGTQPAPATGLVNLGYQLPSGGSGLKLAFSNVTNVEHASGALLVYSYQAPYAAQSVSFAENGNAAQTYAWPFGNVAVGGIWQDAAIPLALDQLRDGADTVTLSAPTGFVIANIDLILQGAGGASAGTCAVSTAASTVATAATAVATTASANTTTAVPLAPMPGPVSLNQPTTVQTISTAVATLTPTFAQATQFAVPTVAAGGQVALTTVFTDTGGPLLHGLADVEIYDANNQKVGQFVNTDTGSQFTPGGSVTLSGTWTAPAAPGVYTVRAGVWGPDWTGRYMWTDHAASITVQ